MEALVKLWREEATRLVYLVPKVPLPISKLGSLYSLTYPDRMPLWKFLGFTLKSFLQRFPCTFVFDAESNLSLVSPSSKSVLDDVEEVVAQYDKIGGSSADGKMVLEQIFSLPPLVAAEAVCPQNIVYADSEQEVASWYEQYIAGHDWLVLGFDTETRPYSASSPNEKVSLVQLATEDSCLLAHVCKMEQFSPTLEKVLANPQWLKVGMRITEDCYHLNKDYHIDCKGVMDLSVRVLNNGVLKDGSLQEMAAVHCLLWLSKPKHLTRSDWAAEELSREQQQYAALDAWVSRAIFMSMSLGKLSTLHPPQDWLLYGRRRIYRKYTRHLAAAVKHVAECLCRVVAIFLEPDSTIQINPQLNASRICPVEADKNGCSISVTSSQLTDMLVQQGFRCVATADPRVLLFEKVADVNDVSILEEGMEHMSLSTKPPRATSITPQEWDVPIQVQVTSETKAAGTEWGDL
eukprot:GILK01009029.1.p1 GENE.GILK01009029.1~~GILK01009029.1.p1  ORF type:complete len:482 (+),score=56.28 GILK01009029.1:61-1446(+)